MIDGEEFLKTGMKVEKSYTQDPVLIRGKRIAIDLGLVVYARGNGYMVGSYGRTEDSYSAPDIHRLLSEGCEVLGYAGPGGEACANWEIPDDDTDEKRSLTAYLIGIRPLKVESREAKMEGLLRQAINLLDCVGANDRIESFASDVRKLLGESK